MKTLNPTYISWVTLMLAIIAWSFIGFFSWSLSVAQAARVSGDTVAGQDAARRETELRLRVLARETEVLRAELEEDTRATPLSIVESIESVGKESGVSLEIGQVLASAPVPSASPSAPSVRTISVVVEATGSFTALMHTASLLSSIPLPSTINQLHFELPPTSASNPSSLWHLTARVSVLTTAEI